MFPPFFKNYSKGKEGKIGFKKKAMKRAVFITGLKSRVFNGNLFNKNYYEGQVIRRNKKKWLVHIDGKQKNIVHLFPMIKARGAVNVVTYFPGNKISAIKKGQPLYFQVANASGTMDRLIGKVKEIGVYPVNLHGNNVYEVVCQATSKENLKYGMEGNATIITGKSTYFEYFKQKL